MLTTFRNVRIPARELRVRTGSDADYVDQPGKPGDDSVLITIDDVDLPGMPDTSTRVDRLELIAALGGTVVRQRDVFSSGAHQWLNSQPWAVIEKLDDGATEGVVARFAWSWEADEYVEAEAGGDSTLQVDFAPNGLDNAPLANPGNPILADVRHGITESWKYNRADFWLTLLGDRDPADLCPYQRHALRVLTRWVRLVEAKH